MDVHPKSIDQKTWLPSSQKIPSLSLSCAALSTKWDCVIGFIKTKLRKTRLVLKKYKAVVFVHGCFWHKHACDKFRWPKTRVDFWRRKAHKKTKNVMNTLFNHCWKIAGEWQWSGNAPSPEKTTPSILLQKSSSGSLVKGLFLRLEKLNSTRTKRNSHEIPHQIKINLIF